MIQQAILDIQQKREFDPAQALQVAKVKVADMKENLLHIKDVVKQALTHSIYRIKAGGRIFEGEFEVAKDEDDLVKHLADEDNQEDLITLEQKLKAKKLAAV